MSVTKEVKSDALNRALRTLWTGFGVDALVLIGVGLATLLSAPDVDVTSPVFWQTLGVLAVKSVLTAVGSYLVRLKVSPKPTPVSVDRQP